jgi:hypothetical protein
MKEKSGSQVLKEYLLAHIGEEIGLETLNKICGAAGLHHWDRVARNLEQQNGYIFERKNGVIIKLLAVNETNVKAKRKSISKKLRYLVFERDNFTCQGCGRTPKDGIKLSPDHIIPVDWGGETNLDNLQALCRECNEGKQAWVSGEDAEVMKLVQKQNNTYMRLKVYFENHSNEEISVDRLSVIAKTREWTRALRSIREKEKMDIVFLARNKKENREKDAYLYKEDE